MEGEEAWEFAVTIPAGTPIAAPLTVKTVFPPRRVAGIQWLIPPGPSGKAGWRITMGGVQVVPANIGAWIIRDGALDGHALARLPDSGAWDVTGYNTGAFPHTIYVTFVVEVLRPAPFLPVPIPLADLQVGIGAPLAHPPRGGQP